MIKELLIALLVIIVMVLILALKKMISGQQKELDQWFRLRIVLSIVLMLIVVVSYYAQWLRPSVYIDYL